MLTLKKMMVILMQASPTDPLYDVSQMKAQKKNSTILLGTGCKNFSRSTHIIAIPTVSPQKKLKCN